MLSQRLRIERFGGLRIGYQTTNMLLRDASPGQFSDHIALRGIRHESFSPAAAGHSRHEFSLLEMEPLRRYHAGWRETGAKKGDFPLQTAMIGSRRGRSVA